MGLVVRLDGRDGFAALRGDPSSMPGVPPIVLVHGAGMDRTVWRRQMTAPALGGRALLAVDLPGHGRSAGPAAPDISAMADWLAAFLDAAKLGPVLLAGHSMGALVALDLTARHRTRVARLVLMGAAARMKVNAALLDAAAADPDEAARRIAGWSFARVPGGDPAARARACAAALVRRRLAHTSPGLLAQDLAACDRYDGAGSAAQVAVPALVVAGVEDRMCPAAASHDLASRIIGAEHVAIERAGHMMMLEAPERVTALLVRAA